MPSFAPELLIVLLLIVLNGVFAMSEMAIVSARKARLAQRAADGDRRAQTALELANDPNQLLSTIQVGITLIGIVNGAFGGATMASAVGEAIQAVPFLAPYSAPIGFGLVVSVITYLSLVVGELVPKRLALGNPERVAVIVAGPMRLLAMLASPVVRLLSASNDFVLRLLGSRPSDEAPVTEDEIKILIQQGTRAGVFHETEQALVERVFRLGDARVDALMTPRHEVVWHDLEDSFEDLRRIVVESGHSRFPVARGSLDDVLGIVAAKSLLAQHWSGTTIDLAPLIQQAVFVPESMDAFRVLETIRQSETQLAVVVDEYGGTQGIVTAGDILEAFVGSMPSPGEADSPAVARLDSGAWSVDGMLSMDELSDALDLPDFEPEDRGAYRSLGGFIMTRLGRVPEIGDRVEWADLRFEVLDMDGKRVDRVLVQSIDDAAVRGADDRG